MARITVEDCLEKVPNRFHLVQMASIRTKQIKKGARALVGSEGNKEVVVALREIRCRADQARLPEQRESGHDYGVALRSRSGPAAGTRRCCRDRSRSRLRGSRRAGSQLPDERETETSSPEARRVRLVYLIERIEDELLIVGADSDAFVLDGADELASQTSARNLDPPVLRELDGVVEEQEQDLVQLGEIGPELRKRLVEALSIWMSLPARVSCTLKIASSTTFPEAHLMDLTGSSPASRATGRGCSGASAERGAVVESAAQPLLG